MGYEEEAAAKRAFVTKWVVGAVVFLLVLWVAGLVWGPQYNVWSQGMHGRAQMAEAEYGRQTLVAKARAEMEAADLYAKAEVLRAEGAAKSAAIISRSLENNTAYLQYLAIQSQKAMSDSPNHTTVYIPTGSNGIPLVKAVP